MQGQRAIVIGASMAGLLASRVLCDHFDEVVVVERDRKPAHPGHRKGVPQDRHVHALLVRGMQIMERHFPGLMEALQADGATSVDLGSESRFYHWDAWKPRTAPVGNRALFMSRPLLEWHVTERVRALAPIVWREGTSADALLHRDGRVCGASIAGEELPADLVIDASGRGSRAPQWLSAIGRTAPEETSIASDVAYGTRLFRRPADAPDWKVLFVVPEPPGRRGGLLAPVEGDRWIATVAGLCGDEPPRDPEAWLDFAKSLPVPDFYEAVRGAEPEGDVEIYRYRSNRWRHYHRLADHPDGFVAVGDAVCSFNPIYGQGMTIAAIESEELAEGLAREGLPSGFGRRMSARLARIVKLAWGQVSVEDLRHPDVPGDRGPVLRALQWYTGKFNRGSNHDLVLLRTFQGLAQFLLPPETLFRPSVAARILTESLRRERIQGASRTDGRI